MLIIVFDFNKWIYIITSSLLYKLALWILFFGTITLHYTAVVSLQLFHIDEKQLVYGFAQYVSSVSAEKTWMCMNGYELSHNNGDAQNHHLDVSFCTPGQTRDDVYNNIVNSLVSAITLAIGFVLYFLTGFLSML